VKPLAIDLYCGLGGWTEGLLAAGYEVVGFDIEQHVYGDHRYPAQLVLQDVRTLHGSQFRDAALIVASSPCQEYSYMAMPWSRAKQIARALRGQDAFPKGYTGSRTLAELNALFDAPKRIQREAIDAAGHFIPMIQENVRGAQKYVGQAQWKYGSFYLWGDVPAIMPQPLAAVKVGGITFSGYGEPGYKAVAFNGTAQKRYGEAVKGVGIGSVSWAQGKGQRHPDDPRNFYSGTTARKAASARIAMIPRPLADHIARTYYPSR
jgi:hypothetical protein